MDEDILPMDDDFLESDDSEIGEEYAELPEGQEEEEILGHFEEEVESGNARMVGEPFYDDEGVLTIEMTYKDSDGSVVTRQLPYERYEDIMRNAYSPQLQAPQDKKQQQEADSLETFIRQHKAMGYTEREILEYIADWQIKNQTAQAEPEDDGEMPEFQNFAEEVDWKIQQAQKPLLKEIERLRKVEEQRVAAQAQSTVERHNESLFQNALNEIGLSDLTAEQSIIIREALQEAYGDAGLIHTHRFTPRQVKMILRDAEANGLLRMQEPEAPVRQQPRKIRNVARQQTPPNILAGRSVKAAPVIQRKEYATPEERAMRFNEL